MKGEPRDDADGSVALSLTLPAQPRNVGVVRQALAGLAEAMAIDGSLLADINVAVTEACTNVVVHAYPERPGEFEVEVKPAPGRLTVIVRDDGSGFQPRVPNEAALRLGLPLIAALTDELEVAGGPHGSGTEVRMTFAI